MLRHTIFALAALLVAVAPARAAEYRIDPAHTFVEFRIQHLGYSWLYGRFNDLSGRFAYDPGAGPEAQSISLRVATASVDTNHAERDKHLRSPDFLDVDTYPEATFVSTGFKGDDAGGVMTGDLTVHGVTRPIEVAVTKVGAGPDPWGGYRAGFAGTFTLTRKDFGMTHSLGPKGETVEMTLSVEGIRQ